MNKSEFRNIMEEHSFIMEVHKNDWLIMCTYVYINNMLYLNDICRIMLIGNSEPQVWFNKHHMWLKDLKSLSLGKPTAYF